MASLSDLLNSKSKKSTASVGGQLQQTSKEELNNLAAKSGLTAAPTSTLGAQMLGAGPDSAKMAGSAQQKQAAIRQSIQGESDLQTQQRQQQSRKVQNTEEQAAQEKAKSLAGLGELGGRVQELINKKLSAQSQPTAPITLTLNEQAINTSGVPVENQQEFKDVLGKLTGGTATPEDVQRANQLMGRNASNLLTPEQLKGMFGTTSQQVGTQVTQAVANDLKVGDLDQNQIASLGFSDSNQLAQVLNVAPSDLGNMTVEQLQEKVKQIKSGEYQKTQTLQQQSSDPNLGAAERKEARALLREAGAVGTRAADEQIADLAQQVDEADTVKFAGEQLSVRELLSDEKLNGTISRYFDDPNYKEQLEKEEPEFADWLKANEASVKQMMDKVDPAVKQYNEIQAQRTGAAKTAQGTVLSDDLMKMVYDDWGSLGTTQYDTSKEPEALKIIKSESADPTVRANLEDFLNQAAKSDKYMAQNIMNLSRQELASLGVFDKGSTGLQDYLNYNTTMKAAYNANTPEEFLTNVFGVNMGEAQQLIDQANSLKNLGIDIPGLNLLDSDGDGKVDSLHQLRVSNVGPGKTFDGNQLGIQGILKAGKRLSDMPKGSAIAGSLADAVKRVDPDTLAISKYTKDGKFDDNDALDFARGADIGQIDKLLSNPNVNLGSGKKLLSDIMNSKVADQVIGAIGRDQFNSLNDLKDKAVNTRPENLNPDEANYQREHMGAVIGNLQQRLTSETNPSVKAALKKEITSLGDAISRVNETQQQYEAIEQRKLQQLAADSAVATMNRIGK